MWVDEPHKCELPLRSIYKVWAVVGNYFECDHCKATWQVQARVPVVEHGEAVQGLYNLTFIRRVGDHVYTISWVYDDE